MSYDAEEHRYDDERYEQQSKRRRLDSPPSTAFTSLRLVAKPSSRSPLPPDQTLALLDPSSITSIGRDRAFDLRIRLKELAVSKTHATLFWLNGDGREESGWAIADCGSQHGTLVQRADSEEWERTSEPKKASRPFRLRHMECVLASCSAVVIADDEAAASRSARRPLPLIFILPAPSAPSQSTLPTLYPSLQSLKTVVHRRQASRCPRCNPQVGKTAVKRQNEISNRSKPNYSPNLTAAHRNKMSRRPKPFISIERRFGDRYMAIWALLRLLRRRHRQ